MSLLEIVADDFMQTFPVSKPFALALQILCAIMVTISLIYIRDHDPDGWWNLFIEWGWWRSNNTTSDQIGFLYIEVNSLSGFLNYPLKLSYGIIWLDQEGIAAVFGNGLSTACVVNIGAQVTSLICIEVNETYFIMVLQHILFLHLFWSLLLGYLGRWNN